MIQVGVSSGNKINVMRKAEGDGMGSRENLSRDLNEVRVEVMSSRGEEHSRQGNIRNKGSEAGQFGAYLKNNY